MSTSDPCHHSRLLPLHRRGIDVLHRGVAAGSALAIETPGDELDDAVAIGGERLLTAAEAELSEGLDWLGGQAEQFGAGGGVPEFDTGLCPSR